MPGKVKIKIIAGRNLPVMDRSSDTTDAYVEIKLGNTSHKTDVCRKSLNPQWNSEWYRFEVDDSELQDEPLQIRLMDHDTYSANDAIGKVYLNLNPLLVSGVTLPGKYGWTGDIIEQPSSSVMSGWIPVYDTMHGIRGEVNITVKVELFSDFNKFRQSSCGVQFFCSPTIPHGFYAQVIHGFIEELVVNDDPEYQWIDKIRTPRASNEARQTLFLKLSGELQRKIGVKALDLGGNAVIGYNQCFDLEGESGIVARGIGTVVTLIKHHDVQLQLDTGIAEEKALSYLKFLASDNTLKLNNDNLFERFMQSAINPSLSFLFLNSTVESTSGLRNSRYLRQKYQAEIDSNVLPLKTSMSSRCISEDVNNDLAFRQLLHEEDMRGASNYRLPRRIRYLRSASQNSLSKKMVALKAKLSDSVMDESLDDVNSLSTTEDTDSLRSSLFDLRELRKRKKFRLKNNNSCMAELLVRSVMQANTSLDCILESHDPATNLAATENLEENETQTSRESNVPQDTLLEFASADSLNDKSIQEPYLLRQDSNGGNASSYSDSSSSDEDLSDNKDDDKTVDFDTVSLIVRNVQEQEGNKDFQFTYLEPSSIKNNNKNTKLAEINLSKPMKDIDKFVELYNSDILHMPLSAPAVINKNEFIFPSNVQSQIEPLTHSALFISNEKRSRTLNRGISKSCEEMTLIKTSEKKHSFIRTAKHLIDKVNITTPPVARQLKNKFGLKGHTRSNSNPNLNDQSLVKTAMQTMLMEKLNLLTSQRTPFTARKLSNSQSNPDLFIQSSPLKLNKSVSSCSPRESFKSDVDLGKQGVIKVAMDKILAPKTNVKIELKDQNLVKTAMQTMLMDKINILTPDSIPFSQIEPESRNDDDLPCKNQDNAMIPKLAPLSLMENMELEDEQIISNNDCKNKKSFFSNFKKKYRTMKLKSFNMSLSNFIQKHHDISKQKHTLVDSAVKTILIDKLNNLRGILPTTSSQLPESNPMSQSQQSICSKVETFNNEKPNVDVELDTGNRFNNDETKANKTNDANFNTNAAHASCLYPSDRRIMESPPDKDTPAKERSGHQRTESTGCKMSQSPARLNAIPCIHRRSSDSDLSITPKGNSLTGSDRSGGAIPGYHHIRNTLLRPAVDNFDMMEYPFLTISKYPPGFILNLGGAVSARSVKLLERITNIDEPETRDTWWSELRMEIRTHARALNCNAVLGYTESTSICDEVCVLSASGTAAVIALYNNELNDGIGGLPSLHKPLIPNKDIMTTSLDRTDFERDKNLKVIDSTNLNSKISESPEQEATIEFSGLSSVPLQSTSCRMCHIPYSESSMSFRVNMIYCALCRTAKVPDIILATIEMPEGLPIIGRGCFLQSYVCRPKRDLKGELNAKEISESLPFLEYELHRLLVNKMKVKAMNTIFGLKVRITIGEKMLIGIATGTAVFLSPLPPPPLPKLIAGNAATEEKKLAEMQRLLVDTVKKNKEIYELKDQEIIQPSKFLSDTDESDDEKSTLDLGAGNKESCVLEVDDSEDIEVINLLVEPRPPDGFHVVNTEVIPGLEELEIVRNLQMFTQVWRAKIPLNQSASHFGKHFQNLLKSVYFKLRRMIPCAICDLQFTVDLPEPDEIQLTLLGMALGLGDPIKLSKFKRKNVGVIMSKEFTKKTEDELIFNLEEDYIPENSIPILPQANLLNPHVLKYRQKSPQRLKMSTKHRHTPIVERHGVDITPLSYVPGGRIERYLGYLNFFFIRESTSIREGGGLSGFIHSFLTEVLAIVRAHVTALGGNAMVAYFMTECVLYHNAHKNQGQCLINVGGDVVFVSYFTEDS